MEDVKKEKKKKIKKISEQDINEKTNELITSENSEVDCTNGDAPTDNVSESFTTPLVAEKCPSLKKKTQRASSNVFALFTQRKIQEFKEAFNLMDQDKDGFISKFDLKNTFNLLGREVDDRDLESMLREAPGPLNFTLFLTIFGQRISGADDESVILSAFSIFDEGNGKMKEEVLKNTLKNRGDKFTLEEVETCLQEAPVDREGYINIRRFTKILTTGDDDDDIEGG